MTRLLQLQRGSERRVALLEEPRVLLLEGASSIVAFVQQVIESEETLSALARRKATGEALQYDPIYRGESEWRLLPAMDHPEEPARCLVSGTGLTHLGSAKNRNAMHEGGGLELTDSMKMFRQGVQGGKPRAGLLWAAPSWVFQSLGN